jgi:outer membrane protein, heavy metal efflux system
MKQIFIIIPVLFACSSKAQEKLSLDSIISIITSNNPTLKMYDAEIRYYNEAAKGARNWEAPELSTGLWMTPYNPNLWKKQSDGSTGMGQYMISTQQMFPGRKRLVAEENYMQAMSSVEKEKKNASLNELMAAAKENYFEWVVVKRKLNVLDQDEKMLDFMIKNAEIRYRNNLGKISSYYKAKAALGTVANRRIALENEIFQKQIMLNTLMSRDKTIAFDIDTSFSINDYSGITIDSSIFSARSDIKAIQQDILLTQLKQETEWAKLKPEFGLRYDHMFGFGGFPMQYSIMGTVRLPMAKWSSRASKANVESLKWKTESLNQQKQALVNEASGMTQRILREIDSRKRQMKLFGENIIPALRKNYQTIQLGYEQNTEELFELYDAWESLNITQLEYLDQLQQLLMMQVELERILEIK